jgi:apolipoprotein N-acyltransferase
VDWLTVIFSASALIIAGFNVACFCIIKFNDMLHLQKSQEDMKIQMAINQKEIKDSLLRIEDRQERTSERIAKQEGRCSANHGN